jgi:predicted transcriptional regulator
MQITKKIKTYAEFDKFKKNLQILIFEKLKTKPMTVEDLSSELGIEIRSIKNAIQRLRMNNQIISKKVGRSCVYGIDEVSR